MKGRMVRGGRSVARLVLVWVASVVALLLLDRWLTGFALPSFWQAGVIALAFGVLSAVLWPLLLRIALPVALYTLGVGSFLLLGAALLGLSFLIPGVVIADLGTAVVVAVAMSVVTALVSSLLGLDEDELFGHPDPTGTAQAAQPSARSGSAAASAASSSYKACSRSGGSAVRTPM